MPDPETKSTQRIRDPVHNLIEFRTGTDELEYALWRVIQTRPFQRLRRIRQLGFSDLVYPGACHSRFAHSIGVFFTARRLMDVIGRHVTQLASSKVRRALAAALLHDVGHGPFSHAFEAVGDRLKLRMADHEHVSDAIIRNSEVTEVLHELGSGFANDVADIIMGIGKKTVYSAVVSSQFDADRLDYIQRDRLMTGSQHAAIDFEWLLANIEVGKVEFGVDDSPVGKVDTFVLGPKAIYAAEAFVLGLFQLYPTVYFHKATRGAEKIFAELLAGIIELVQDGKRGARKTGLPDGHPLVKFAKSPDDLECALALDDGVIWGALPLMIDADDPIIARFARCLRDRTLYKCIDVRSHVAHKLDPKAVGGEEEIAKIDTACAKINPKLSAWSEQNTKDRKGKKIRCVPRILCDETDRSPYKPIEEAGGRLNRINIRTANGDLVDLADRSSVVTALRPFKLFRVYVDEGDTEAKDTVHATIEAEVGR